jgi:competence protein ComEA
MFKKLLLAFAAFITTMGFAFAQVDANKADQAALDGIKGIGPKMSKTIIEERSKGGDFKDWTDFEKRVKGVGEKNAAKLSQAGLTIGGQSKPNVPGKPSAAAPAKAAPAKTVMTPAAPAPAPAKATAPAAPSK